MEPACPSSIEPHEETLIDWFLSLKPGERLAELESRLAFFNSARTDGQTMLPAEFELLQPSANSRTGN